jgi:hypothetical protein
MPNTVTGKTKIVNLALTQLGVPRIASFDDAESDAAELARGSYDAYRDAVLEEFPWNFATKRVSASALNTPPRFGYRNSYPLEDDCLRVLEVYGDADQNWGVETTSDGLVLASDIDSPVYYRYIARVEACELYSALFVQALAARLSMEWCLELTSHERKQKQLAELYSSKIRLARTADSQEKTPEQIQASEWVDARFRGTTVPLGKLQGDPQPL